VDAALERMRMPPIKGGLHQAKDFRESGFNPNSDDHITKGVRIASQRHEDRLKP